MPLQPKKAQKPLSDRTRYPYSGTCRCYQHGIVDSPVPIWALRPIFCKKCGFLVTEENYINYIKSTPPPKTSYATPVSQVEYHDEAGWQRSQ